jgi:class 3 adenylate cyclase
MALAGWPLLLPAAAALLAGGGLGLHWAPRAETFTWLPGDLLALTLIAVFSLALARSSCHQARRLYADRVVLAGRTTELERLTGRMRRYLPPSLRERLLRSAETRSWERRWLTVVFVDLVGFAELAERQEAEPLAQLLDDYLTLLVDAAEGHGGEVSKMLGDGVLVVFGADADASDESGRARAVAQALTFSGATPLQLAALAARWEARGEPVSLRMRAGVASGYCTLGDRGGADRVDFTLVGSAVNLASRLQAAAPEDGVLLDAASAVLAATHFPLAGPLAMTLKGIGPVSAYQLLDASDR